MNSPQSPSIDTAPLLKCWDDDRRVYRPRTGVLNNGSFGFAVRRYTQPGPAPTQDRVMVHVAPELQQPGDALLVANHGWGETSALFDGDFLSMLLSEAQEAGYQNPHYVAFNAQGRGTPDYDRHRDRISTFGLEDHLDDAGESYRWWRAALPPITGDIHFFGHSLGTLACLRQMREEFDREEVFQKFCDTLGRARVRTFTALSGIMGSRAELLTPKPVKAVLPHVMESLKQGIRGKGALSLSRREKGRIMMGRPGAASMEGLSYRRRLREYDSRTVDDSARAFLALALPTVHPELDRVAQRNRARLCDVSTLWVDVFGESLLPEHRLDAEDKRRARLSLPKAERRDIPGTHALPVKSFTPVEMAEWRNVLREIFSAARRDVIQPNC